MAAYIGRLCLTNAQKYSCVIGLFNSKCHILPEQYHRIWSSVTRNYVRGVRRSPVKVIFPDKNNLESDKRESADSDTREREKGLRLDQPASTSYIPSKSRSKSTTKAKGSKQGDKRKDHKRQSDSNEPGTRIQQHDRVDDQLNGDDVSMTMSTNMTKIKYERANADDHRLGKVMTILNSRKTREKTGKLVLEGRRLITDALQAGAEAQTIFFSKLENLWELPLHLTDAKMVKVPFRDISAWSDLVSPHGVIGIFKQPRYEHQQETSSNNTPLPLTLICDNIRDPGNMGTILRSAVAAHCNKILVTKGCVDIWEAKVLRAGAGAHFRSPILNNLTWNDVRNFVDKSETTFHIADNNIVNPVTNYARKTSNEDEGIKTKAEIALDIARTYVPDLETQMYYEVDWKSPCALVIGGETQGLSLQALELCDDTYGCRVNVPMSQNIESLNNAMTASIIMFEAKRQFLEATKKSNALLPG